MKLDGVKYYVGGQKFVSGEDVPGTKLSDGAKKIIEDKTKVMSNEKKDKKPEDKKAK